MRFSTRVPSSRWKAQASAASTRPSATKPNKIRFTNCMPVSLYAGRENYCMHWCTELSSLVHRLVAGNRVFHLITQDKALAMFGGQGIAARRKCI